MAKDVKKWNLGQHFFFLFLIAEKAEKASRVWKGDEKKRERTNPSQEKGVSHSTFLPVYIPLTIRQWTWCTF